MPVRPPLWGARFGMSSAQLLNLPSGGVQASRDAREPLKRIRLGIELGFPCHRLNQHREARVRRYPAGDDPPLCIARHAPTKPKTKVVAQHVVGENAHEAAPLASRNAVGAVAHMRSMRVTVKPRRPAVLRKWRRVEEPCTTSANSGTRSSKTAASGPGA